MAACTAIPSAAWLRTRDHPRVSAVIDGAGASGGAVAVAPPPETRPPKVRLRAGTSMLDPAILRRALVEAFLKLDPRHLVRNPVMFVVELGSLVTTVAFLSDPVSSSGQSH